MQLPTPIGSKAHFFSTRDLVLIALIASIGGVLSTYITYLGKILGHMIGLPMGGGQIIAGLHIVWLVIAFGLVGKPGTALVTGLLKGLIELFMGSTHGVIVVAITLLEGGLFDLVMVSGRVSASLSNHRWEHSRNYIVSTYLAATLAAFGGVLIFYAMFFSALPIQYILAITALACGSGAMFGAYLGRTLLFSIEKSGIVLGKGTMTHGRAPTVPTPRGYAYIVIPVLFLGCCIGGALSYHTVSTDAAAPSGGDVTDGLGVTGAVENELWVSVEEVRSSNDTVSATFQTPFQSEAEENYTGIPLSTIITYAEPYPRASKVSVIGRDGYTMTFQLEKIATQPDVIVTADGDLLRLVADSYDGSYWVHDIVALEVY